MNNLNTNPEANETTITVPKKYRHMVSAIHQEPNGYWVYTAKGFYSPMMGCGSIHESNQNATLAEIRNIAACADAPYADDCYCGHDCR